MANRRDRRDVGGKSGGERDLGVEGWDDAFQGSAAVVVRAGAERSLGEGSSRRRRRRSHSRSRKVCFDCGVSTWW